MEHWKIRQPKLTYVLKNTDDSLFHQLALDFTKIMETEIKLSIIKDNERWMIYFNHAGDGYLRFYISLHDPTSWEYLTSDFEVNRPTVQIHDLELEPQGKGLGTQLMFKLLEALQHTQFEQIVLRANHEQAARFWSKFGFEYKEDTDPYLLSMILELYPVKRKKTIVRIQYK